MQANLCQKRGGGNKEEVIQTLTSHIYIKIKLFSKQICHSMRAFMYSKSIQLLTLMSQYKVNVVYSD